MVKDKTKYLLEKKKHELVLLHEFDEMKESAQNTEVFLTSVLRGVMNTINTEMGMIILYDEATDTMELGAVDDKGIFRADDYNLISRIAKDTINKSRIMVINNTISHPKLKEFKIRNILSSPIRYGNKTIGVFILLNKRRAFFRPEDLYLFSLIISHLDSDIEHSKAYKLLRQKNKELNVLYTVDHLRDTIKDFDTLLNAILDEMTNIINAKMPFIALYDNKRQLKDVKVPSNIKTSSFLKNNGKALNDLCLEVFEKGELTKGNHLTKDIDNFIAIPAILENVMVVFGALNSDKPEGFGQEDERLLIAIAKQADSAIFEDVEKQAIKTIFGRYVSPQIMEKIIADKDTDYLKTYKKNVTVLFTDLRGFTALSEDLDPQEVAAMLNDYFDAMTKIILAMKGTIDKFVGDEIMAIFGAPLYYDGHELMAVKAAYEMQRAFKKLEDKWKSEGKPVIKMGIGINSGDVVIGNIGCSLRTDYTVIGDAVNIASRLCSNALGGQILISEDTYAQTKRGIKASKLPPLAVKGKREKLVVYEVLGTK